MQEALTALSWPVRASAVAGAAMRAGGNIAGGAAGGGPLARRSNLNTFNQNAGRRNPVYYPRRSLDSRMGQIDQRVRPTRVRRIVYPCKVIGFLTIGDGSIVVRPLETGAIRANSSHIGDMIR